MYLETDRLIIRSHSADDFEDYYSYIMEPELKRMLGLNNVTDRTSALETFQWLQDNVVFLALIHKETQKAIGHICLHPPSEAIAAEPQFQKKTGFSLSFAVAKNMQRKGYMEEALRCLISDYFSKHKADYFDCEYASFNTASRALQEKLGFQYWGEEQFSDIELIINLLICH